MDRIMLEPVEPTGLSLEDELMQLGEERAHLESAALELVKLKASMQWEGPVGKCIDGGAHNFDARYESSDAANTHFTGVTVDGRMTFSNPVITSSTKYLFEVCSKCGLKHDPRLPTPKSVSAADSKQIEANRSESGFRKR